MSSYSSANVIKNLIRSAGLTPLTTSNTALKKSSLGHKPVLEPSCYLRLCCKSHFVLPT